MVTLSANQYLFKPMNHNYITMAGSVEICLEKSLQPAPISNDTNTTKGFGTISKLKDRLQERYEAAYPSLANIISYVIDQEEANARNVSSLFPHLVLPGLVEIHMRRVGLELLSKQPAFRSTPFPFIERNPPPVFA